MPWTYRFRRAGAPTDGITTVVLKAEDDALAAMRARHRMEAALGHAIPPGDVVCVGGAYNETRAEAKVRKEAAQRARQAEEDAARCAAWERVATAMLAGKVVLQVCLAEQPPALGGGIAIHFTDGSTLQLDSGDAYAILDAALDGKLLGYGA